MHEPGIIVKRSAVFRYGVAAVAVAAATAVRLVLEPVLGLYSPYLPFTLAIIVASRFGGRGPGLAATALSLVSVPYFFLEPLYDIRVSDPAAFAGLVLFAGIGITISFLIGRLRESLVSTALSEERLRLAQTKAQVGIWDRNPLTGQTTFTPELERSYGLDPGTIKTYEDWRRRVHPDDIERIEAERDKALASHMPFDFEFRAINSSGEVRWFSASGGGIYDQAGNVVRVLGVNIDITGRKQIEQALAEKSARLEELNTALQMAHAFVRRPEGVITHWSRGAITMYGWRPDQAVGRRSHDLLQTEFPETLERIEQRLLERGNWEGELRHHRRDGSTVVVASHWALQRDEQGRPSAVVEVNNDITALRQAEEALRKERGLLDAIMKSTDVMLVYLDPDFNFLAVNAAYAETCKMRPEEMIGKNHFDLYPNEENEAIFRRVRDTGEPVFYRDKPFGFPDQPERGVTYWDWSLTPVRDASGKVEGLVFSLRETTKYKKAEEAVRESQAQFRTLADAIPQLCWMANADGWIFWYNQRWYEYTGTTPEQMKGWGWQSVHDPEALPEVLERWKASIATGQPFDMTFPLRGADGVFRPFLTLVVPVRDQKGDVTRWFGTNTDISEQRKTEQALRESEERLRLAQQAARVGTFEWNIQTGVNRWSPELEALYGLPPGGFAGTEEAWEEMVHPEDRPEAVRRVQTAMDTGSFEAEWRVIQPNGAMRWLSGRAWLFKDDSGKRLRLIGVNIDVTELKQAEEEIRQLNAELEQRVRERTAQLEAANKELEAFAYSVSHDLRAPLRGIDGWSLALVEDYRNQLDERACEYLERVRSETQRMGLLIDDLLELSRITRADIRREAVDLTLLAETIAARLRETYAGREIEFIISPGLRAAGDARLLEIALTNLLANAVKFTGPRARARVEFGKSERDGERAFYIRDNGVGFDMAYAGTLFGAFQRLHKTSEFPGTGVGLATVQRIIRRHGGRVWAEAQLDRGATFYFTIGESAR